MFESWRDIAKSKEVTSQKQITQLIENSQQQTNMLTNFFFMMICTVLFYKIALLTKCTCNRV